VTATPGIKSATAEAANIHHTREPIRDCIATTKDDDSQADI